MATQYTTDIPISSSHTQQAFKLLELPPELLSLLESENPPTLTITSSTSAPSYAILTHGTNKYQMRQKNTSNPLLILQPSRTGPTPVDDADGFVSQPSVTAVAKIEDTVELILQEEAGPGEKKKDAKVNKWHEKFARSRAEGKR
ncbi:sister chromatid cohesion protein Dcc1 [Drepanopeziza brunnea f. sp. 'multigermtubi' MB_m1]|uniref:Sister chromatid cohesion protein Dcc1 n=1 Tax=Marssonina brunnea f. sp. multigermtubi (strain MB_m1) TaxID=1072389 RepID=K1WJH5_MARBU|nr:sister chromatid cohesion protein Dcc1 [Drepanopeziza brunnea f. sp. 'multigermtubi' MB_m1]EKD12382.1 sister chromatid cohesion protein Dcc1 [Drepanopeziza brunnea f. sp. 'multigermtubi' MB_m1]